MESLKLKNKIFEIKSLLKDGSRVEMIENWIGYLKVD